MQARGAGIGIAGIVSTLAGLEGAELLLRQGCATDDCLTMQLGPRNGLLKATYCKESEVMAEVNMISTSPPPSRLLRALGQNTALGLPNAPPLCFGCYHCHWIKVWSDQVEPMVGMGP